MTRILLNMYTEVLDVAHLARQLCPSLTGLDCFPMSDTSHLNTHTHTRTLLAVLGPVLNECALKTSKCRLSAVASHACQAVALNLSFVSLLNPAGWLCHLGWCGTSCCGKNLLMKHAPHIKKCAYAAQFNLPTRTFGGPVCWPETRCEGQYVTST